jgi:hypothetical protein
MPTALEAVTADRNDKQTIRNNEELEFGVEGFAFVNRVAWVAARFTRYICARSQRGVERIGRIVHDVHGGEGEERCVEVEADLRSGFSESQGGTTAERVSPLSRASHHEYRSSCLSYPALQPLHRRVCRPLLEAMC